MRSPRPAGLGASPLDLTARSAATLTIALDQRLPANVTGPRIAGWGRPVTLPGLMAKAKRRKLRARRKKANHGRRPNAGRG